MTGEAEQVTAFGYAPAPDPRITGGTTPQTVVRLNFNVSESVANDVATMANEMNISKTQLFRYAFGILKIAMSEARKHRKLVIADEDGTPLREIVLPG
jgi:hypothetical protein